MRILAIFMVFGFVQLWKISLSWDFICYRHFIIYTKKTKLLCKKNIIKKVTPNKNSFFYHISLKNSYPGILSFFIRTFCNHFACLKFNNFDPLWLGIFIHHFSLLFLASKKALSSEFLKDPYNAWWVIIAAAFFTELRYAFL